MYQQQSRPFKQLSSNLPINGKTIERLQQTLPSLDINQVTSTFVVTQNLCFKYLADSQSPAI
jgi:hypothetical protein